MPTCNLTCPVTGACPAAYVHGSTSARVRVDRGVRGRHLRGDSARLFAARNVEAMQSGRFYDVSQDGKRFLMIKDAPAAAGVSPPVPISLVLVLDWTEDLERRLPTK